MDFRILVYLCLIFCGGIGCYQRDYSPLEETAEDDEEEEVVVDTPPPPPPKNEKEVEQSSDDDEFDMCPDVTYVLWEDEHGIKYTVTLDVFCEPIPVFNLGCPAPGV